MQYMQLLTKHLKNIWPYHQPAYIKDHSNETALRRVHHDIACALANNSCAVLVKLDLSAAFDVMDNAILHKRLQLWYNGNALLGIKSYMSQRTQRISIGSELSNPVPLDIGVFQGSGPKKSTTFFPSTYRDFFASWYAITRKRQ